MNPSPSKTWFTWTRLLALTVTGALLFLVFRQLPLGNLGESLGHLRPGWFAAAFAIYGAALVLGGLRSHSAYRLTDRAVHASASCRAFFAGHFFFVVLFGAAAGDVAKSAVYARWYQFRMAEVLAAAPLDRFFGFAGTTALALGVTALVMASGGFQALEKLHLPALGPWLWILSALIILALCLLVWWAPQGEAAWKRTIQTFRAGVLRLTRTPRLAANGFIFAFLAQSALSAVIALNLAAVTQSQLDWARIVWTFPVITIIGCVPFTVAGAGVREAAALTFLGLYNVPPGDCVAAALLTLVTKLTWAMIGGAVLWREESLYRARPNHFQAQSVSVVIPTLNEAANLAETIQQARLSSHVCEIIVVDGGSVDSTAELARNLGCQVLTHPAGRGGQLRAGAAQAKGDVILLLHADTFLPSNSCDAMLNCLRDRAVVAGGFWKIFQKPSFLMLGSKIRCGIRLVFGGRIAGDQGMFIRREVLSAIGGVPDVELMEDFELSRRLRQVGRLALADATVVTSARRFRRLGVVRTYLRMWWVTTLYRFGVPPQQLRKIYERE
jgi:rSAM/selenodomain-associated transferase 2